MKKDARSLSFPRGQNDRSGRFVQGPTTSSESLIDRMGQVSSTFVPQLAETMLVADALAREKGQSFSEQDNDEPR